MGNLVPTVLLGLTTLAVPGEIFMTHECFNIGTFGHHLYQDGELVCETIVCNICVPEKRTYVFKNFNGTLFSTSLIITRVADFDSDSDGIIGFKDFGAFTAMFNSCIAPNGRVTPCD